MDGIRCEPVNSGPPSSSVSSVVPERAQSWCVQPFEPKLLNHSGWISRASHRHHISTGLSYEHKRVAWAIQCIENKQITLSVQRQQSSLFSQDEQWKCTLLHHQSHKIPSDVKDESVRKFSYIYTAHSRSYKIYVKLKIVLFFVILNEIMLKQALEENTLHLSVVARGSSQHLSFATSLSIPPSMLLADVHTWSRSREKPHKHAQQSISWT